MRGRRLNTNNNIILTKQGSSRISTLLKRLSEFMVNPSINRNHRDREKKGGGGE